jgi:hypothetical protein
MPPNSPGVKSEAGSINSVSVPIHNRYEFTGCCGPVRPLTQRYNPGASFSSVDFMCVGFLSCSSLIVRAAGAIFKMEVGLPARAATASEATGPLEGFVRYLRRGACLQVVTSAQMGNALKAA